MSVTVTLHIFSGRPNPTWELSELQAKELADRIASIENTTLLKPAGLALGILGYRGFSISSVREKLFEPHVYIHGGIVELDRFDINRIANSPELEEWLLSTAGDQITDDIRQVVSASLSSGITSPVSQKIIPMVVPNYDPGKWNNNSNIRTNNNCYNYANDKITYTFAQPGRGGGLIYSAMDCGNVGSAAQRDGQIPISSVSNTPVQGHYVALVIWPGYDFHWYRLDSNTRWSHKPGQTPVRNTDNSGNLINDPSNCDRGNYTNFCGFYHCIPANTRIQ